MLTTKKIGLCFSCLSTMLLLYFLRCVIDPTNGKTFDIRTDQFRSPSSNHYAYGKEIFRRFINDYINTSFEMHPKRYMVYTCDGRKRTECGGWGDRINGIVSGFLLSILTDRQFRINHKYPVDLETFYRLRHVKADLHMFNNLTATSYNGINSCKFKRELRALDLNNTFKADVVYLRINWNYIPQIRLRKDVNKIPFFNSLTDTDIYTEIMSLFLVPQQNITDVINDFHDKNVRSRNLVCAHIRRGKSKTIPNDTKASAVNLNIFWKWMDMYNTSGNVIYIATDSDEIKSISRSRYKDNLIEIPGQIVHIDKPTGKRDMQAGFKKVILEYKFLITCDVLLLTHSGFSATAAYIRGSSKPLYCFEENSVITSCHPNTLRSIFIGIDSSRWC